MLQHPTLKGKLAPIFKDRYDWANFLGACRDLNEVDEIIKMVPVLFQQNPELELRFNQKSLMRLLTEARSAVSSERLNTYFAKKPEQFLATFYREIYLRLYESPRTSALIIEQGCTQQDLQNLVKAAHKKKDPIPDYFRISGNEELVQGQVESFKADDYYHQVYNCAFSFVEFSKDYFRNENVQFLRMTSWMLKNMSLPTYMDRPEGGTPVDHLLANMSGLQTERFVTGVEAEIYQPFTTGNCWDQASIQLLHLAIKGPATQTEGKQYAYHVGNSQADHSYVIISSFSYDDLVKRGCLNKDGSIQMLKLFEEDQRALISDPWAKAVYSQPVLGLHYAVHPHNDDTKPPAKLEDQDKVSITSYCTVGEPLSVKIGYNNRPIQDRLTQQINSLMTLAETDPIKQRWHNLCAGTSERQLTPENAVKSAQAVFAAKDGTIAQNIATFTETMQAWEARRDEFRNTGNGLGRVR